MNSASVNTTRQTNGREIVIIPSRSVRGQVGHQVQVLHLQQEREQGEGCHGGLRPRGRHTRDSVSYFYMHITRSENKIFAV